MSILQYIEITDKGRDFNEDELGHDHVRYKKLHYSSQKYLSSHFITYEMNMEADNLDNMFKASARHEYIQQNEIANSCMASLVIDVYKESFDKYHESKCKTKDKLTYEFLYKLIFNKEYEGGCIGLTIEECKAFFEKYRLGLEVYNHRNQCLTKIEHGHITPILSPKFYGSFIKIAIFTIFQA
jgi:hypothetical protein